MDKCKLSDEEIEALCLEHGGYDAVPEELIVVREALRIQRERIVAALIAEALSHKIHEAHNVHDAFCDFADRLENS